MSTIIRFLKVSTGILGILALLITLFFGKRDLSVATLKPKYANEASKFVVLNEMNVHYRDEGITTDTIPIVLIHGTGSSLHTFDVWTKALTNKHRVVRMDLPGFGLTGPATKADYSQEAYTLLVKQLLDHLNIDKCIIGGNSLGGRISWNFTLRYPKW